MAHRFTRKQDEETSYWLSYSDMMAGLLLCFVLIISFTVLHAKIQYDEKETELFGKEQELMAQTEALSDERATVAAQQALLDEQKLALTEQADKLTEQEKLLGEQHKLLSDLEKLMQEQQARLDEVIGVRSELVKALKEEFDDSNLSVAVDEQTGAITFHSSILFDYNETVLKESGEKFLSDFLPRYVKILLGDKYREYISEIIIEGHTDTSGEYLFNLELSQERAYSVTSYCLSEENDILSEKEREALRAVVTASGRSYSNPVLDEDGEVDMDASRRVEILFRLKDEEMIREMIEILNAEQNAS